LNNFTDRRKKKKPLSQDRKDDRLSEFAERQQASWNVDKAFVQIYINRGNSGRPQ